MSEKQRPTVIVQVGGVKVRLFRHNDETYAPVSDFLKVLKERVPMKVVQVDKRLILYIKDLDPGRTHWGKVSCVFAADVFVDLLEDFGYDKMEEAVRVVAPWNAVRAVDVLEKTQQLIAQYNAATSALKAAVEQSVRDQIKVARVAIEAFRDGLHETTEALRHVAKRADRRGFELASHLIDFNNGLYPVLSREEGFDLVDDNYDANLEEDERFRVAEGQETDRILEEQLKLPKLKVIAKGVEALKEESSLKSPRRDEEDEADEKHLKKKK